MATAESANQIVFPFTPQPRQKRAAKAMSPYETTKINGFGGPKFGGKSWTIQYLAALHALSRPINILVVGHKYEDMKALHIEPLSRYLSDYIEQGLVKPFHSTNKQFVVPKWESIIKFQQVKRDADAMSLNGQAWDIVLIDEAQKLSPFSLSYLQGVCRISHTQSNWRNRLRNEFKRVDDPERKKELKQLWDDTYYWPKMLYCFNWGEKGHSILKRWFWDGCKHEGDPYLRKDKFQKDPKTGEWVEDPHDYQFIFAPMEDNKIGMEEDPGYVKRIKSMEEPYRTAYLTGDPTAFAGLKYEIHPNIHEVDFDEYLEERGYVDEDGPFVPEHWALYGAIDPGTEAYCAASLYAKTPEGLSFQLTDYYVDKRDLEKHIDEIVADWQRCPWTRGRKPDMVFSDRYATNPTNKRGIQSHDITFKDVMWNKHKIHIEVIAQDRITAAQAVQTALAYETDEDGNVTRQPKLFFARRKTGKKDLQGYEEYNRICEPTITEIVSLESDPKRPEDIKRDGVDDHAFDKTKNYLLGAASPPRLPADKRRPDQKPDYGRQDEDIDQMEEAEYEEIGSYGSGGSIASYMD